MKKSVEILGLPVIAITDGKEIGKVIDLVVNPKEGLVEYLVLETGVRYSGTKIICVKDVECFGEDAITTEVESSVVEMKDVAHLNELLEKDIRLKGTKVLTKKGKIIGKVTEFHIDEEEIGKISGLELASVNDNEGVQVITAQSVLTFGKDAIIIKEQNAVENNSGSGSSVPVQSEIGQDDTESADSAAPSAQPAKNDQALTFEERQRQFLLGRKVSKTIVADTGEVIVKEGTEITKELIEKVIAANKYADLLMNYSM